MKKLLTILMAAVIVVSLAACGDDTALNNNSWTSSYVPSDKASVTSSFVVGNEAKFTILLADNADVVKVGIACMYFDASGNLLDNYEILTCAVSNEKYTSWESVVPDNCVYAMATIAHTTDSDGNKETCEGIEDWVKAAKENFTVSGHKAQLSAWTKEGKKAETCEYVKIEDLSCSGTTLDIELTNLTDKELSTIQIYLLLFDENGDPVEAGGNTCPNSKLIELVDLLAEENATYEYTIPEHTVSVKGIVRFVEVDDEIVWQNDYLYEWLFSNYNSAK